jgi:hypothetical protein
MNGDFLKTARIGATKSGPPEEKTTRRESRLSTFPGEKREQG